MNFLSLLFATSFFLSISEKCSYTRDCSCMYMYVHNIDWCFGEPNTRREENLYSNLHSGSDTCQPSARNSDRSTHKLPQPPPELLCLPVSIPARQSDDESHAQEEFLCRNGQPRPPIRGRPFHLFWEIQAREW